MFALVRVSQCAKQYRKSQIDLGPEVLPFCETLRLLVEILVVGALISLMRDVSLKRVVQAETAVRTLVMSEQRTSSNELTITTPVHPGKTEELGGTSSAATPILVSKPAIRSMPGSGVDLHNTYGGRHGLNRPAAVPTVAPQVVCISRSMGLLHLGTYQSFLPCATKCAK